MPASTKTRSTNASPARRPRRFYAATVVALAIFVLGVAFWRTPVEGYRATASVVYETSDAQIASTDAASHAWPYTKQEIARQAVSPEIVRQAVMTMTGPNGETGDEAEPARIDEQQLAAVVGRFSAAATPETDGGGYRIFISYVGSSAEDAVPLVNTAAESFVGRCVAVDKSLRQSLTSELEAATTRVDKSRQKLESIEQQREIAQQAVADAKQEIETAESEAPRPSATTSNDATPGPSEQAPLNPDWVRLRDHVTRLEDQKATLGATLTEAHPEMKEVMAEIAVFAAILDRTPKYADRHDTSGQPGRAAEAGPDFHDPALYGGLDAPQLHPANNSDREPEDVSIRATASKARLENASRRVEQLEHAYELAREELSRAQQQEDAMRERVGSAWFVRARIDTRADSATRIGGVFPLSRVFIMLGVGLAVGAVVFMLTPRQVADRVLRRVVDVEERVGLPVVGAITANSGTGAPSSQSPPRRGIFRLLVVAAEFVLIAVVVAFLVAALLDRQLAAAYLDDPFAAFGETLKAATQSLLPK